MRKCHLDRVDGSDQVGVDDIAPRLQRRLAFHPGDAGLRDDDVDLAEFGEALIERSLEFGGFADIGLDGDDAAPGLLDQFGGLFEILGRRHLVADGVDVLAQVDSDDVGALFGQPQGVAAPPLPACRTGDEGDLAWTRPIGVPLSRLRLVVVKRGVVHRAQVLRPSLTPEDLAGDVAGFPRR